MQINRYSFPLSVHYIPEGIVHYMTECRQVTRRRRHKKKEKTFKKLYTISRNPCTVYPGIRCTVYPGISVHYVPEYSGQHSPNYPLSELFQKIQCIFSVKNFMDFLVLIIA